MQELTLTGATLLSDHPAHHSATKSDHPTVTTTTAPLGHTDHHHQQQQQHHHHDSNQEHPYLTMSLSTNGVDSQQQQKCRHSHHDHGSAARSPPARPILTLKQPASDIVAASTNYDLYHLLLQIIRMGPYELFLDLAETWRTRDTHDPTTAPPPPREKGGEEVLPPGTSWDRIIHAYDTNGHTLTHWAAKRCDDVRILQYLLTNVVYDDDNSHVGDATQQQQFVWNGQKELVAVDIAGAVADPNASITPESVTRFPTPIHRPTHDQTRMTPLHWACTQENGLSIIKVLLDATVTASTAKMNTTATTNTGMNSNRHNSFPTTTTPTTIPSILEIRDGTGCTPCLIASQHGRVETVAYLIQRGANIYAVDTARDSMIHWAAYKGSEQVLGLISYYCPDQQFYTPDAYGQTPLHLASLRGHVSVVRYILHHLLQQPLQQQQQQGHHGHNALVNALQQQQQSMKQRMITVRAVRDLLALKDQNGRTPYDLAVHKNKPAVAAVLKSQMLTLQRMLNPSVWEKVRQYGSADTMKQLCWLRTWKTWLGLPELDDLDESPRFPFYYVIGQVVCHFLFTFGIFIPVFDVSKGVLWDYVIMLMINVVLIGVSAYTLYKCHTTNPGRLDSTFTNLPYWRRMYEQTLDAFASSDESIAKQAAAVPLCHTCHIARPPRSKHDRFSRSCILQFDHHCPFVGTTIGLYNYKWFFMFILSISIYFINFWIMLLVHYVRTSSTDQKSLFTLLFGIYLGLHILFSGGMVIYHSQLIFANLTTNEHINLSRYDYLWDTSTSSRRIFANPWDKGCFSNMYDRFILPGDQCYLVPTDQHRESFPSVSPSTELYQPLMKRMTETV